jgi:hypothetical protein
MAEITKQDGMRAVAKQELDLGKSAFSEFEATRLWTESAHRDPRYRTKGCSPAQSFARLMAADPLVGQHIQFCKIDGWQKGRAAGDGERSGGLPVRAEGGPDAFDVNSPEVVEVQLAKPFLTPAQAMAEAEGRRRAVEAANRRGGRYGRDATLERVSDGYAPDMSSERHSGSRRQDPASFAWMAPPGGCGSSCCSVGGMRRVMRRCPGMKTPQGQRVPRFRLAVLTFIAARTSCGQGGQD